MYGQSGVDGDYGAVCTHGTGKNNWEGYSINGRYVLSADSDQCGIFNDVDNGGYAVRNSYTSLYHNGGECFRLLVLLLLLLVEAYFTLCWF